MRKVSKSQAKKNRILAEIKKGLDKHCTICGQPGNDLAHILCKNIWPEYYTLRENVMILCRDCHVEFDKSKSFRRKQTKIYQRAKKIDRFAAYQYFKL
jgi:hypothetical protein